MLNAWYENTLILSSIEKIDANYPGNCIELMKNLILMFMIVLVRIIQMILSETRENLKKNVMVLHV